MTQDTSGGPPIFIVGSPRSGTTLTRLMLDTHPAIACGPETHFLVDLESIVTRHWHRIARYGHDEAYWNARCREFFGGFQTDYAASKGKARWADKTPAYSRHLPFVLALFPEAQVVHVIRDAHAVVSSSLDRWGWRRAWDAPSIWRDSVEQARAAGATLPTSQYREVRFEDLVGQTEPTLRALVGWLGEQWDPQVLDYDRFEHDESGRNKTISSVARSGGGTAVDAGRARTQRRRLDPVLRLKTARVAGRLNRDLGYA